MKKIALFIVFAATTIINAMAQKPVVFLMDADRLAELKTKARTNDKETATLIASLVKKANSYLSMKPVSVMDKGFTPASGSKHDYMSQAPYFWYDSSKPNGLPYMRKDGQRNPEINKITDHQLLDELEQATQTLSVAYYLTGDEKYATKASSLIKYWFFNEATKMNPNLDFAQAIPGVNNGRGIGIIESRFLTGIADAAGLLAGSTSWKQSDTKALQQWYSQYLNWLLTSKNGNDEHKAKNNHGTWYLVQAADFALFTGDKAKAAQLAEQSKKWLDSQITAEGKQPLELERTNGLGYSTFNLSAWFELATLAEKAGVDLWNYKNANGATLRTALDWLTPYALGEKKWDYQQIGSYNKSDFYPLLIQGANKYKNGAYAAKAKTIKAQGNNPMVGLIYKQ
jgi:hypothetical protein